MNTVAIANSFRRHQKQALSFMLRREQGWAFDAENPDLWDFVETEQGHM